MNEVEIIKNELSFFSDCPRVFALEEVVDRIDIPINPEVVCNHLLSDRRFLCVRESLGSGNLFIPKRAVLSWYIYLNIHLGKLKHPRISKREFLFLMRSLSISKYWESPPKEIVDFGEHFGFVGSAESSHEYVFPLAYLLSFVPSYPCGAIAEIIRESLEILNVDELTTQTVDYGISQLKPLEAYVLLCRTGWLKNLTLTLQLLQNKIPRKWLKPMLSTGGRLTLQQIAYKIGGTRERIRQIEKRACCRKVLVRPFMKALIYEVVSKKGRLVYEIDSQYPVRALIAKCLEIPCVKIMDSRLFIMGLSSKELKAVSYPKQAHDTRSIVEWIESTIRPVLLREDIKRLSETISSSRPKRLPIDEKLRAILKSIGRPAHYSEIAEVYNEVFQEDARSETSINSNLHSNKSKNSGIVWIGDKGMFALKEWGYKRPRHSLKETVRRIVEKKYKETHKPVSFEIIVAELGKYRKFVRKSSLNMTIKSNLGLERISNGLVVPRKFRVYAKRGSGDSLDKILQRFERQRNLNKYHR